MPGLKVNPNRMEVLKLRKRLLLSRRGHKLLKQKQDELMKILAGLMEEARGLREKVEERASSAYRLFFFAEAAVGDEAMDSLLKFSKIKADVKSGEKRLLNLVVPEIQILIEYQEPVSGFLSTESPVDEALDAIKNLVPLLARLYEIETQLAVVAEEIEKTRRRVNALEYILIPDIEDTIKSIVMKLDEMERGSRVRLMKVKELADKK
jgi:V/A-type H+/Na+-transporting ATPase subunit D